MDFSTLQGLTIPEGVVTQIAKDGVVLWKLETSKPVILEVEKFTANTYAGETTYENEEFILLDIYPKTNGTVNVTYGGLTKTITDTSGVEEPNAQQVFFGTFKGVSDSVATPTSGTLTIEGDCDGFGRGNYSTSSKFSNLGVYRGIKAITSFGSQTKIANNAFQDNPITSVVIPSTIKDIGANSFMRTSLESLVIENGVKNIYARAFAGTNLKNVVIPKSVVSIGNNPFQVKGNNIISVDSENEFYKIDENCLIEIATNKIVSAFADSIIPTYVTEIGGNAFTGQNSFTSFTIPSQITHIGDSAFWIAGLVNITVLATTPPTIGETIFFTPSSSNLITIEVPKGCLDVYKSAWSYYASNNYVTFVEAS